MEKLRAVLEKLKKYHFWILCGLIVAISFLTWFLATGELAKYYLTRKGQIEGKLSLVNAISGKSDHSCENAIKGIRDTTSGPLLKQVDGAANRLYNEQRENNPLPVVFNEEKDQKDFEAAFGKIWAPMEEIEKLPPNTLDETYRSRYRYHIEDHFPKLFELIERRTPAANNGPVNGPVGPRPGPQPAANANVQMVGIVDWDDAEKKIKEFSDRFSRSTPSTLDIMMTQEELWVYETLLKVIRNTNNVSHDKNKYVKPPNHKEANIKQILAMDIGSDAVRDWKNCENALINLPGEGSSGGDQRSGQPAPVISRGGAAGSTGATQGAAGSGVSLLAGRYVDEKGKPLDNPSQQPYPEFRMMPINLKVIIEQKAIPRLLAECANSAMRIDVRGVRILEEDPGRVDVTAADAPTGGAPPVESAPTGSIHRGGGMGMGGMGVHGAAGGGAAGAGFSYNEESVDPVSPPVPVEVQGIIYIYNPPRKENAGEAGNNAATAAAAGAPATPVGASTPSPKTAPAGAPVTGAVTPAAPAAGTNQVPNPARPIAPPGVPGAPQVPPVKTPSTGGPR